jgi:hypothetical protein
MSAGAEILAYTGSESQLVDRMVQNLHPKFKSYLLFASRPESVRDLFLLATTVAETVVVEEQHMRLTAVVKPKPVPRPVANNMVLSTPSSAKANHSGRCWGCGASDHFQRDCPSRSPGDCSPASSRKAPGRPAISPPVREPDRVQPGNVCHPRDSGPGNTCVTLRIADCCLPAMLDSDSSKFFLRRDVFNNIKRLALPYSVKTAEKRCLMANGESCVSSEVVVLKIKIHSFRGSFGSWS